ncbi:protein PAL OF QUIRKY [Quercus suber]|uniref:PB1 domain-containing protein n=1 Tax=Quercus suber TaxID=58331 RepID=A0AAW0KSZ9_QUESU
MTSSYQATELELGTTDSVASSPRGDDPHTRVRFMCSFGGKILPRPHDNQLRYVGGDTRIFAVHRATNYSTLLTRLSKLSGTTNVTVKYQLPNEDLDALISVTTDEDVENMLDEYDRCTQNQNPRSARLRLFLFRNSDHDSSRNCSISSVNRDHWFLDAINHGGSGMGLERGRSEASSIVSELPDYLFGLDNSEETQTQTQNRDQKIKTRQLETVSNSDPGSPAPVVSSPFYSTSSVPSVQAMLNLPPVKTKPDSPEPVVEPKENQVEVETGESVIPQPTGYPGNQVIHYISDPHYPGQAVQHVPVYYMPGPVQPGNVPVQTVHMQAPYVPQYPIGAGQIPVGYHHPDVGQVYGGGMRPITTTFDSYDVTGRMVSDGVNQQAFYGVKNPGIVPMYSGMMVPGGKDLQGIGSEVRPSRASQ